MPSGIPALSAPLIAQTTTGNSSASPVARDPREDTIDALKEIGGILGLGFGALVSCAASFTAFDYLKARSYERSAQALAHSADRFGNAVANYVVAGDLFKGLPFGLGSARTAANYEAALKVSLDWWKNSFGGPKRNGIPSESIAQSILALFVATRNPSGWLNWLSDQMAVLMDYGTDKGEHLETLRAQTRGLPVSRKYELAFALLDMLDKQATAARMHNDNNQRDLHTRWIDYTTHIANRLRALDNPTAQELAQTATLYLALIEREDHPSQAMKFGNAALDTIERIIAEGGTSNPLSNVQIKSLEQIGLGDRVAAIYMALGKAVFPTNVELARRHFGEVLRIRKTPRDVYAPDAASEDITARLAYAVTTLLMANRPVWPFDTTTKNGCYADLEVVFSSAHPDLPTPWSEIPFPRLLLGDAAVNLTINLSPVWQVLEGVGRYYWRLSDEKQASLSLDAVQGLVGDAFRLAVNLRQHIAAWDGNPATSAVATGSAATRASLSVETAARLAAGDMTYVSFFPGMLAVELAKDEGLIRGTLANPDSNPGLMTEIRMHLGKAFVSENALYDVCKLFAEGSAATEGNGREDRGDRDKARVVRGI